MLKSRSRFKALRPKRHLYKSSASLNIRRGHFQFATGTGKGVEWPCTCGSGALWSVYGDQEKQQVRRQSPGNAADQAAGNVIQGALQAYQTQKDLEAKGASAPLTVTKVTLLAGPAFFEESIEGIKKVME